MINRNLEFFISIRLLPLPLLTTKKAWNSTIVVPQLEAFALPDF